MSNKNPNGIGRHLSRSFARIKGRAPVPRKNVRTQTGVFAPPAGERGSATNPLGPRSRRRKHWTLAS